MEILKRNGSKVKYDGSKIVLAIKMSMADINTNIDEDILDDIETDILNDIEDSEDIWTVEMISDRVEKSLMVYKQYDVAKSYILHRDKKNKEREEPHQYKLLTKEFLSKYKKTKPPMTELGSLVYYRTYSRWLSDKKRREYWWETCARSIDFNCSLQKNTTKQEAEKLFDNMFYLRQFLSGRTLWSGGTETAYSNPISQYNCSFLVIDNFNAYKDICYLLMLGVGVGFSVEKEYVSQLPKVRGDINLIQEYYSPVVNKKARKEITEYNIAGDVMEIIVGDSKLGWSSAIDYMLKAFYSIEFNNVNHIMINYNNVRPQGEPLKTFGGTASGHEALKTILDKIYNVVKKDNVINKKLRPIEAMDIANIIAEGIVVGGVRRSAEMCLFDYDDKNVMDAKSNLYIQENGEWKSNNEILHRMMSNNSVAYYKKPSLEELKKRFETIKLSAEGNFYNLESARLRKSNVKGCNPYGEILLDSKQFCNLTTVNVSAFIREDGTLDEINLLEAQKLSARAGYRIATMELELPEWNFMQARDRLIGCSFTGWFDMVNAINLSTDSQKELLIKMRKTSILAANEYADSLGLNRSELVNSIKPEGSLSQLPTVSSGLHFSHSPYYIRRIRINASDPLVKVCEELGYPMFPEVGQQIETCRTKVIEFPIKAPEGRTKYDVSAIEQLEIYKMVMENYVDHNASNTIHVRPEEWDDVIKWVYDNWKTVIGITFISLDDSFYQLLPYEAITKKEYENRRSKMKEFNPELLRKYEIREEEHELDGSECMTGACPTR